MSAFKFLSSIKLTVFCLLWLAVLTVWGTVYQVDNGIYQAQERFFDSIFFRFLIFPLPGGMLTMMLLFFNLCVSFFVHYQAGWRMPGLMLTHLGLILLLLGGFFTKVTGLEASVSLLEGEGSNVAVSRSDWEISVAEELHSVREIQAVDFSDLKKRKRFHVGNPDLRFRVVELHRNTSARGPKDLTDEQRAELPLSPTGITEFVPKRLAKEPPDNIPGIRLEVEGAKNATEMVLWGGDQQAAALELEDGSAVFVMLRRKRFELPLFMELRDFRRTYYPGSNVPEDYRSLITVYQGEDSQREVVIKMNHPFRNNGWTFFQQSFAVMDDQAEQSVFAVTRNFGRLIPYWGTGVTSLGLALHFLQMQLMQLKRRRKSA